ncbi:hypothetical protein Desor_3948 [Desulfosporosinus orientis DSM 765]|uniref:DUF2164 domain-containing protein n=1 Tax=Desulfosporosinus orientis (strain ATCC 19365 / DSM 765 / NCIMB 8382 / VKM B-1628 / Singapore I) TaxID=768706 RepID=G7WDZ5_DESOD|nr:DUF2164 domain-containing protein [Desulfosporosinus orientis]AET69393.1 hypothetical protein Desor_3948 [Desulfosporosinus orientis DSM 765]
MPANLLSKGMSTMKMQINIDKDTRKQLVEELKGYFWKERDEDLGNLGAELLLDFIINTIGPHLYNHGIQDAYSYMNERVEDLLALEKPLR